MEKPANGCPQRGQTPPSLIVRRELSKKIGKRAGYVFSLFVSDRPEEERRINRMFAIIAVILVLLWLGGFFAFHLAGGLIHILLVVAVIMIILHFVRGGRSGV